MRPGRRLCQWEPHPGPCSWPPRFAARGHGPVTPALLLPLWREEVASEVRGEGGCGEGARPGRSPSTRGWLAVPNTGWTACIEPERCPGRGWVELGLGKLRVDQAFAGVHAKCHFVTRASSGHHFHFSESLPNCSFSE